VRLCFLGDAGSIHLQRWIHYFLKAGYQVDVISFRPCEIQGAKVHLLAQGDGGRLAYVKAVFKIRSLMREIQPDMLHAHYATSFGLLALVSGYKPLVGHGLGFRCLGCSQGITGFKNNCRACFKACRRLDLGFFKHVRTNPGTFKGTENVS